MAPAPTRTSTIRIGVGGMALHEWVFPTRTFQKMLFGKDGGTTGPDDDFAARGFDNIGAWILGRNMFGPVRGPWPDESWKGWWGDEPPYHCEVFVLTHHPRAPIEMKGGTVFHFVTDGIEAALAARPRAAGGKDIRLGGGVATIRQYLRAGLIDELHLAIAPVLLGSGENLFADIDLPRLGYKVHASMSRRAGATHIVLTQGVSSLIIHPHQIKPLRRRDRAAGGAVARGECCGEIVGAPAAFADPDQRAHHRAHLAVQERARGCHDADVVAVRDDVELVQRLLRRFRLAFGVAEGGEIMLAEQALRGRMHRVGIERPRHAPDAAGIERQIGARLAMR